MFYIIGLGNPGEEYENTRHNVGRMMVSDFAKKEKSSKFKIIIPATFMNKSGEAVRPIIKSKKAAASLIVVHDDLDLPLGRLKIAYNRGSGGHKGVESIIRAIKTEEFIRVKVGISPSTSSGKLRKPDHEKILDFIVGPLKKPEMEKLKKVSKKVSEALKMIITEGKDRAMGEFNSK